MNSCLLNVSNIYKQRHLHNTQLFVNQPLNPFRNIDATPMTPNSGKKLLPAVGSHQLIINTVVETLQQLYFHLYKRAITKSAIMAKMAFQHQAGTAMECLSIPITLHKEKEGENLKCGFKIGGGIDQDYNKSPQGYTDNGIYVTEVHESSPASRSGLRVHDKILQCNGYDFTMVTHKKAVSYIKKHPILNLLVARKGVTST